jgi:hypothetical protein
MRFAANMAFATVEGRCSTDILSMRLETDSFSCALTQICINLILVKKKRSKVA